jgi:hypothetical protein
MRRWAASRDAACYLESTMPEIAANASTHSVQFYEDDADLLPHLVKYIGTALRLGHDAIVIGRPKLVEQLSMELHREHVQRSPFGTKRGQLTTLDAQATLDKFMVDGWPDPERFDRHVAPLVERATVGGKTAVAYGEMVALLCERGQYAAAIKLEKIWNGLLDRLKFSLLCAYPMRLFSNMTGRANYQSICNAHSHVIGATQATEA